MTRYAAAWLAASTFLLGRQYLRRRRPNNSMDETRGDTNKQEPTHPKITVGIAVTVTGCSKAFPLDGAAVLQYSLFRNNTFGRYEYAFYAIYHPTAFDCVAPLASLGFALLKRDTPVNVSEIRGTELRERISGNGTCQNILSRANPYYSLFVFLHTVVFTHPLPNSRLLRRKGIDQI